MIPNSWPQNLPELPLFQVFGWTRNNTGKNQLKAGGKWREKAIEFILVKKKKKTEDKSRLLQPWEISYNFALSSSLGKLKKGSPSPGVVQPRTPTKVFFMVPAAGDQGLGTRARLSAGSELNACRGKFLRMTTFFVLGSLLFKAEEVLFSWWFAAKPR